MSGWLWVAVSLIGGGGAVLRFVVDGAVASRAGGAFPVGTMVVNVSGALVLGFLAGLTLAPTGALLAGTAAVGSYTTFSTWMLESQRLVEERRTGWAALNIALSLVLGLVAAAFGGVIGQWL